MHDIENPKYKSVLIKCSSKMFGEWSLIGYIIIFMNTKYIMG